MTASSKRTDYHRGMRIAHIEAGRYLYAGAAQVRYLTEGLTAGASTMCCSAGQAARSAPPQGVHT